MRFRLLSFVPLAVLGLVAHPLANEDVLEPSVENEVAHAIDRALHLPPPGETNLAALVAFARLYETNGLSATDRAIRLVSTQRVDGRWIDGTNDVTAAALRVLSNIVSP